MFSTMFFALLRLLVVAMLSSTVGLDQQLLTRCKFLPGLSLPQEVKCFTPTVSKLNDLFYGNQRVDPKRNVSGVFNTLSR